MNPAGNTKPYDPPLDRGIEPFVAALNEAGVETFESCEGGEGHAYLEPTVRFHGDRAEGFRALAVAQRDSLPVKSLRRAWPILDGEPTGPYWEITFVSRDLEPSISDVRISLAKIHECLREATDYDHRTGVYPQISRPLVEAAYSETFKWVNP